MDLTLLYENVICCHIVGRANIIFVFERKILSMSMSVEINMKGKENIQINNKMLKTNLKKNIANKCFLKEY